jgi:predicted DNA-binding transcriptional regulator AlpA
MKTVLDQEDVELIARRVAEMIRPLLSPQENSAEIIFSVEELSDYLRVSVKWVYDHTFELPHFKLGGLLRFRKKEIDRVIERLSLKVRLNKAP